MSRFLLPATVVLLLAACQPPADAPPSPAGPEPPAAAAPADVPAAPAATAPAALTVAAKPERPALAVETVDHGPFDLAAQRGQWVVVNFWATWCAPCLKEIPDLNALDEGRDDVTVVGLAYEETTPDALRAFYAEKVRPTYPVAIVDVYNPPADFETPRGLPYTVLVDPDGRVAKQFLGPVTGADIAAAIDAAKAAAG
ncbi:MAG: TlpA family protein disulfide reductase [Lysobacteraceae bacterium]|jgi:thiol-disulfide isomerase/thioredoxin|nr:TlpA disulfide reductase family protein [Silanimonas sp.]